MSDRSTPVPAASRDGRRLGGGFLAVQGTQSRPSTHREDQAGTEEQGAKEEQTQKIDAIVGDEVLGYEGSARGEHSGQSSAGDEQGGDGLADRLADNRPEQVK
jgi:hypothetical protein